MNKDTRRIDLWVGRIAAVAGIVYVALASIWPIPDPEIRPAATRPA